MHPLFSVTVDEIKQLDDQQAEDFIALLCKLEATNKGLSPAMVKWGGNLKAPDKGVDIRIDGSYEQEVENTYIPKAHTIFQIKAVNNGFNDASIRNEMMPKGKLRDEISLLADNAGGGAYIIVSTRDDLVAVALEVREQTMKGCLQSVQLKEQIVAKFYASQQVTDWANQYPTAITWIKYTLNKSFYGFKPYTTWAYKETDITSDYIIDDKARVIPSTANKATQNNESIQILEAINQLREKLNNYRTVIRLVGLSGVGKTRLVQALFDERIETSNVCLDKSKVIYCDTSDIDDISKVYEFVDILLAEKKEAILVIDNCGTKTHAKLVEKIDCDTSLLSLITIEYDIREDFPTGTDCYTLASSSSDMLKALLAKKYPNLSSVDLNRIAEFADGNARIAFVLADTIQRTGSLGEITDNQLFERIFLQNNPSDNDLLYSAQVCSLLYSFDAEDTGEGYELAFLANIANIEIRMLQRNISELKRRGLIQQRGKWKALLPHAIANRLAANFISDDANSEQITKLVQHSFNRIRTSFSRRLGYLHNTVSCHEIVCNLFNNIISIRSTLTSTNQTIIRNIAPVIPNELANFLITASEGNYFSENTGNVFFAELARLLAYDVDKFDSMVKVLVKLFQAYTQCNHNKVREIQDRLCSLFWPYLSGTLAQVQQRLNLIKELINSNEKFEQEVAIQLLKSTIRVCGFSSSYSFEFGARARGFGWYPQNHIEQNEWYKPFLEYCLQIGQQNTALGRKIRAVIASEIHGLWLYTDLTEMLEQITISFYQVENWVVGWIAIKRILLEEQESISTVTLAKLQVLEQRFAPKNLGEEIEAYVLSDSIYELVSAAGVEDPYSEGLKKMQQLGMLLGENEELLYLMLLKFIGLDSSYFFGEFCNGIGQTIKNPMQLFVELRKIINITSNQHAINNYTFIAREILGVCYNRYSDQIEAFLDKALYDEVWQSHFIGLQCSVGFNEKGFTRLIQSLQDNRIDTDQYYQLAVGSKIDSLPIEKVIQVLELIQHKENSDDVMISNLWLIINSNKNKKDQSYNVILADFALDFLISINREPFKYHVSTIGSILNFILMQSKRLDKILIVLERVIEYKEGDWEVDLDYKANKLLIPFFEYYPVESLNHIWQKNNNDNYEEICSLLSHDHDRYSNTHPLSKISETTVIDWCKESLGDRILFMVSVCDLFSGSIGTNKFSPIIIKLFNQADDKKTILDILIERLTDIRFSTGSRASIIRYRASFFDSLRENQEQSVMLLIDEAQNELEEFARKEQEDEEERNKQFDRFE